MTTENNTGHGLDAAKCSGTSPPPEDAADAFTYSCGTAGAERGKREAELAALLARLFLGS